MGVILDLYVGPRTDAALPKETFCALVRDLVDKRAVALPFGVLSGEVSTFYPGALGEDGQLFSSSKKSGLRVEAFGKDPAELHACVERLYGKSDLCVWFSSLDGTNEKMQSVYDDEDGCECWVGLYALREPTRISLSNAYDEEDGAPAELGHFRCYLQVTGKRAPDATSLPGTYFRRLLGKHFGPKLRAGTEYS